MNKENLKYCSYATSCQRGKKKFRSWLLKQNLLNTKLALKMIYGEKCFFLHKSTLNLINFKTFYTSINHGTASIFTVIIFNKTNM